MRLYVLVEGQTEQEFVVRVLEPHLRAVDVWVYAIVVETSRNAFGRKRAGGGRWSQWLRDLKRLTGQHPGNEVRFTTMCLLGCPAFDDSPCQVHSALQEVYAQLTRFTVGWHWP